MFIESEELSESNAAWADQVCLSVAEVCKDAVVDLIFVLDGSGSVTSESFYKNVAWMAELTDQLDLGEFLTRTAVVQYSQDPRTEMNYSFDKAFTRNTMNNIDYISSGTKTGKALTHVFTQIYTNSRMGKCSKNFKSFQFFE